jgi:copper chaperone
MSHTTLSVPEIHCNHCKMSIEGAVNDVDGVGTAIVDIEARTVAIDYDDPATIDGIIAAIEEQGYEVPAQG